MKQTKKISLSRGFNETKNIHVRDFVRSFFPIFIDF